MGCQSSIQLPDPLPGKLFLVYFSLYMMFIEKKKYLVNESGTRKYRINGALRSTRQPNNVKLCLAFSDHLIYAAKELPPKTDLRPYMTAVEDQSQIGSW